MRKDGDFFGERQFRPGRQTNGQFGIIYDGETARPRAEVVGHQFIAGSRTYALEAKVTHFWEALSPIRHYHSLLTAGDLLNGSRLRTGA